MGRELRSRNLEDSILFAGVALWQKGMRAARGVLQMGRELRSRNLEDSFLLAGVALWQKGMRAARGVLQMGRLFRNFVEIFLPAGAEA